MTFDELRITYQSDEQMARALFGQVAQLEAAITLVEAQRDKARRKLTAPAPRRAQRDREIN